jgi:hypothetical protein
MTSTRTNVSGRGTTVSPGSSEAESMARVAAAARRIDELLIIAPESDDGAARELAAATGCRVTTVAGPSDAAAAIGRVLDD